MIIFKILFIIFALFLLVELIMHPDRFIDL